MPQSDPELMPLDEEEIIELFWHRILRQNDPFSDDAAWVSQKKGKLLVSKCDMFVSSTDAPPSMTPFEMGSKAVTSPVSDFAAKGVRPSFALVSIAISREKATRDFVTQLAQGVAEASRKYQIRVLGGDTNESSKGLIVDVCVLGYADSLVERGGARVGDLVGVSGPFGLQAAGLRILLSEESSSDPKFRKRAVESVLKPKAQLSLGLSISKYLTSSIDSSDGLALSLYYLAESSHVDMRLGKLPLARGVKEFARSSKLSEENLVFFGGEEYELVCTFKKESEQRLRKLGITTIGRVVEQSDKRPAVFYDHRKIARKGWIHLQKQRMSF